MRILKMNTFCFAISVVIFFAHVSYAGTFGEVAENLYEPVSLIIELLRGVAILSGSGLILGSFFRYLDYRRNPIAVRLSTVMSMVIFGVALIILGMIHSSF